MNKLWRQFRDWLIRKLGGVTPDQFGMAVSDWVGQIEGLNQELDAYRDAGRLIVKQEQKNVETFKAAEKLWDMEMAAACGEHQLAEIREYKKINMASELGRRILREGAILICEEHDWASGAVVMKMEVKVVC